MSADCVGCVSDKNNRHGVCMSASYEYQHHRPTSQLHHRKLNARISDAKMQDSNSSSKEAPELRLCSTIPSREKDEKPSESTIVDEGVLAVTVDQQEQDRAKRRITYIKGPRFYLASTL